MYTAKDFDRALIAPEEVFVKTDRTAERATPLWHWLVLAVGTTAADGARPFSPKI